LETLKEGQDNEAPSTIVVSDLTSCPAVILPSGGKSTIPNLLAIYDDLVDNWMTNLPPKVSIQTRLSKHKIIRQLAIELCLSSVGISLQTNDTDLPVAAKGKDAEGVDVPGGIGRDSSPLLFSPEMTPASFSEPALSLPSPARTPSVYSHATTTTGFELGENPAITRLRQYAVSIRSQLDPGKSKLLASWVPGGDPAEYSWEEQKTDDSEEEDGRRSRREEARRRKRTEKFLNRERARAPIAAESQSAFLPFGSQPDAAHLGFSSQTVDELPMTQPDRGAFGSRSAQKGKKKQKRRNAGF
jgi:RNA polymerase I-specific transcription initiation factor RRN6